MEIKVSLQCGKFLVDDDRPGSPPIGRGETLQEAIGNYVINNQHLYNFIIHMDKESSDKYNKVANLDMERTR